MGWLALAAVAGCAVRAPAALDLDALVAAGGPIEARRALAIRITSDPRDVAGRLALAALAERIGRPSEAIEALEAVEALGGPLGVRWHDDDRARLARLIAARGRARLARGAATARADLERAQRLGARVTDAELRAALAAHAVVDLHHSDAELRARGRRALAALASLEIPPGAATGPSLPGAPGAATSAVRDDDDAAAWRGARSGASPAQRGQFGAWLWAQGARRAGWDELSAWHAATQPPRDPALQQAYLVAARWWLPSDQPAVPGVDLVGPARCGFAPCRPRDVVGDERAERAYLSAPLAPPVRDPDDAAALAVIALHQALRGDAPWGPALAARVDLAWFADPAQRSQLPDYVRPLFARLTGQPPGEIAGPAGGAATAEQQLVIAAQRALAGADPAEIAARLGDAPHAAELRRVVGPVELGGASEPGGARAPGAPSRRDARALAAARCASLVAPQAASTAALDAIAAAYASDPAIADRLGRDAVAAAVDAAAMHAVLGAMFDALGDPARARAAWQAAVDASPEPVLLRGLAEAQARQGDGDAALITATAAAAASGDPAVVWAAVARALAGAGRYVPALEAARSAIDLSSPETLAGALDTARSASHALGRETQAAALAAQRARFAADPPPIAGDPTDPRGALAGRAAPVVPPAVPPAAPSSAPTAEAIARLWTASRWNPREVALRAALLGDLAAGDPRRAAITAELVELASDPDPERRRAAVAALR
jgi:tetratricopeptide (TPR) repeat protein